MRTQIVNILRRTLLLGMIAATFGLAGCGQKGPLYLPQPEQPAPATPEKTQ